MQSKTHLLVLLEIKVGILHSFYENMDTNEWSSNREKMTDDNKLIDNITFFY